MVTAAVCQPLAASPGNFVLRAASSDGPILSTRASACGGRGAASSRGGRLSEQDCV